MNKKHLIITSTKGMTREDWLAFRQPLTHVNKLLVDYKIETYKQARAFFEYDSWKAFVFPCLGASEVATVMGLNQYKSVVEIFFEKVGIKPSEDFDNIAMFWGRELEEQIAQKWQFWDGSPETLIDNFKAGNKLRRCRKVNAYFQNSKFPWLFASLDRIINKSKQVKKEGSLECKTISGFAADQWESGIPPMYVIQNMTQLLIPEFEFGEIAILRDGRNFDVLPFDYNESICDAILRKSKAFYDKVKLSIEHFILSNLAPNQAIKEAHLHEIDKLSPEPDGSVSYRNYLSNRFQDKGFSKPGRELELEKAVKYLECNDKYKEIDAQQLLVSNQLKAFMGEASEIDFGDKGKVFWRANAKGTRTFRVALKVQKEVIV